MSARLLALFCLLNLGVPVSLADSTSPSALELVVYLKVDAKQPAGTLEWMKRELSPLMRSAGYRVEWRDPQTANGVAAADALVVVELHGACGLRPGTFSAEPPIDNLNSLASTSISEGRVLPFASMNCSNLNRTLGPSLVSEAGARRDFLYGRAMARVLAHEFYHMIVSTRGHTSGGVSKPCFTVGDLLSERFEFEPAVLAKFRQTVIDHAGETPADVTGDSPATGR
jgi:hypothetical protein